MPSQSQIRDEVTARIIRAFEADLLPWRRPWSGGSAQPGRHSNVATKRPYQGVNHILLELHAQQHGLFSRWWGTFPMWKSLGCNIRKRPQNVEEGHWGCRIVFYKPVTKTVVDDQTGDEDEEKFFVLRTFTVFAADQVDGDAAEELRADRHEVQTTDAQPDFAPAEELILATGADIRFGGNRAYYSRPLPVSTFPNHTSGDYIVLPPRATFSPPGAFYETVTHELSHWAELRTGWDHDKQGYALGELAAEIASTYISAELGIPQGEGLGNHVAYLKNWLEALKNDRNYIFKAAKQASKVTDYLLNFVKTPEPEAAEALQ